MRFLSNDLARRNARGVGARWHRCGLYRKRRAVFEWALPCFFLIFFPTGLFHPVKFIVIQIGLESDMGSLLSSNSYTLQ